MIISEYFPVATSTVCSDLSAPTNGESISYNAGTMNNRPVNTVATYTCNDGYVLMGDATRTCQSDGDWSSTAPTCAGKLVH